MESIMSHGVQQSSDAKPDQSQESLLSLKSQSLGPPQSVKKTEADKSDKPPGAKASASKAPSSDATAAKAKSKDTPKRKHRRIASDQIKTDGNQITFDLSPKAGDSLDDKIKELQLKREQLKKETAVSSKKKAEEDAHWAAAGEGQKSKAAARREAAHQSCM